MPQVSRWPSAVRDTVASENKEVLEQMKSVFGVMLHHLFLLSNVLKIILDSNVLVVDNDTACFHVGYGTESTQRRVADRCF